MKFAMTMDASNPAQLAAFWMVARDYVPAPPPEGWATWEAWLTDQHVPASEWDDGVTITDAAGIGPTLTFLKVPEPKSGKNRLHLDLQASGGRHLPTTVRRERIDTAVATLTELGAHIIERHFQGDDLDHVVLADPEGNELCVV